MLSAAVRRASRDVSIMKEKLIFSGTQPHTGQAGTGLRALHSPHTCTHMQGHDTDIQISTHTEAYPPRTVIHSRSCSSLSAPRVVGRVGVRGGVCFEGPSPFALFIQGPHIQISPLLLPALV